MHRASVCGMSSLDVSEDSRKFHLCIAADGENTVQKEAFRNGPEKFKR
jgi:hypothetical protein